jgi:hypothetical protein
MKNNSVKFLHVIKWVNAIDQNMHGRIDLRASLDKDGIYISSEDVPGLHLIVPAFADPRPLIEAAIKRLFKDNNGIGVHLFWKMYRSGRPPYGGQSPDRPVN